MSSKKACTRCKIPKLLTEFGKNGQNKSGLEARCKACIAEIRATKASPEKNAQMKAWREANKEHVKAQKAANYQENKEAIKTSVFEYREKNKAEISGRAKRRYRAKNPNPNERGPVPLTEKVCPACGILKQRTEYYKKLTTISHKCKRCTDIATIAHKAENPKMHLAYNNKSRKKRYANDLEYRDTVSEQKATRYGENADSINAARRERYATDPEYRASALARNRRFIDRQPAWADTVALREIYVKCPEGHEVDHVIPLRGKNVSGLHVPANLQYLITAENRKKYNSY